MVGNPPDLEANDRKTTLLIVPSSVLRQWEDEIALHVTKGIFKKVYAFRAVHRLSMENLQDQDVICECQESGRALVDVGTLT